MDNETKVERGRVFDEVCEASKEIFEDRNVKYGDAIVSTGVLGAVVELIGNVARLRKMVLQSNDAGESHVNEIVEILKDVHNYSNIAIMMASEDNWKGK